MRIITGRQIRAGRALAAMTQPELAKAAKLSRNSIVYWEGRDAMPKREPVAVRRMREALARHGVQVYATPWPGVTLGEPIAATREI